MISTYQRLKDNLEYLKLKKASESLDEVIDFITANELSFTEGLLRLTDVEMDHRKTNLIKAMVKVGAFPFIKENDLVLVVTQSGLSTNAIEALKIIKKKQCRAICLTGNKNSDVKDVADVVIEYGVGEELVGYVTKGVSSLALFLDLFAIAYSGKSEYLEELKKAVHLNEEMIGKATSFIQLHYKEFSSMSWVYSCGAGANYGTALESALKMGETIHIPSCCYEIEEYIHGPNLQLTPQYNVIFFDGNDVASHRVEQVYKATRKVSERAYLISNNPGLADDDHVLSLSDTVSSELCPLVYLPFVQLLSFIISNDLHSIYQHPLLKEFKAIAAAKTENFVNYDGDD